MSDEERPPAPPMRLTSTKDSSMSPASKPLPSAPVDEKKKKAATFRFFKGDEKCKLCNLTTLKSKNGLTVKGKFCFWRRFFNMITYNTECLRFEEKARDLLPDSVRAHDSRGFRSSDV